MPQKFKSEIELEALNPATTDTDKILVSDGGVVKSRTGAEILSDIGGVEIAQIANFETTSQLNTRDTNNRNRANHTGTQLSSTISDLASLLNLKANLASPTFTGTVTAPTFIGALTGLATNATTSVNATNAVNASNLTRQDIRTISPSSLPATFARFGFTSFNNNNTAPYADFLHLRSYQDSSGGLDNLVMFNKATIGMRIYQQTYGSTTRYSLFRDAVLTDVGSTNITISGTVTAPTFIGALTGNASSISRFIASNSSNPVQSDTVNQNVVGYVNSMNLFGQIDGALYGQAHSNTWQHQIFGDYRTGQIAIRGKNNNVWQSWRTVLDSVNFTSGLLATNWAAGNDSRIINGQTSFNWGNHANLYLPLTGGTLTGQLTLNQQLRIVMNGITTTMGALNNSWNHMETNSLNGWYFYNPISIAGGTNITSSGISSTTFIGALNGNATSSSLLNATAGLTTQAGTGTLIHTGQINNPTVGLFPAVDNSNSIITVNRHSGSYYSQLGFSSNGNMYYRSFSAVAINTTQSWKTILDSGNFISGTSATNWVAGNDSRVNNGQTAFNWGNHAGLYSTTSHNHAFSSLTSIPTTILGYGITDVTTAPLTGLQLLGGEITATDTILQAFGRTKNEFLTKQNHKLTRGVSFTAENEQIYSIIGTLTITNPTGVAARGYEFEVLAGTTTVGTRTFGVGSYVKVRFQGGVFVYNSILEVSGVNGGTTNQLAKFTASGAIGNSIVSENGTILNVDGIVTSGNVSFTGGEFRSYQAPNSNYISLRTNVSQFKSGLFRSNTDFILYYNNSTGSTNLASTIASQPIIFLNVNTEQARISPSGNLGVNQLNPTERLDIGGSGRFSGSVVRIILDGTQASAKSYSIVNGIVGISNTGISIRNNTNSTNPFYIDGSDNAVFSGTVAATTFQGSLAGNAQTATSLTSNHSNWNNSNVIGNVVGMLAWKNYGNGHAIFDASNSTSPNGTAVNATNAQQPWTSTFPTLMGWNGAQTYGVRVDSARVSDLLNNQNGFYYNQRNHNDITNFLGGFYSSGGLEKPNNTLFGSGKLKLAMLNGSNLGIGGAWHDVLYMSGYTGGDVKLSTGISFSKNAGIPEMHIFNQDFDSATWGTPRRVWHSGNFISGTSATNWVAGNDSRIIDGQTAFGWGNHAGLYSTTLHNHSSIIEGVQSATKVIDYNNLIITNALRLDRVISAASTNGFPTVNNANAVLTIDTFSSTFAHQLGFSSDGNIYKRSRAVSGWESSWKRIFDSGNFNPATKLDLTGGTLTGNLNGTTANFSSTVTATDFIGSSDKRLKKEIKALKPKEIQSVYNTFVFKSDKTNQKRVGVIAQELELNHPEFVRTDEKGIKSVSYGDLHSAEIAYLKSENKILKAKLELIMNKLGL